MKLNPEQLHIIQHSLGCDQYGRSDYRGRDEHDGCHGFHRNRYVSDPNADLVALVAAGLMIDHGPQKIAGGMHCYAVTRAGILSMDEHSPQPPKVSRSKARFADYWRRAECFDGFASYLGFDQPKVETGMNGFRMVSSRGRGDWRPTIKEAKASYKEELKRTRQWRCREVLGGVD